MINIMTDIKGGRMVRGFGELQKRVGTDVTLRK